MLKNTRLRHLLIAGAGVVLGAAGAKFLESEKARKLGVSAVSSGLKIKEGIGTNVEKAKQGFDDVVAEAKEKNKEEEAKKLAEEEARMAGEEGQILELIEDENSEASEGPSDQSEE